MTLQFLLRFVWLSLIACAPMMAQTSSLVGTWERTLVSLNGVPHQEPPEIIIFSAEGYYMQAAIPIGRPKSTSPLPLAKRYQDLAAAQGPYSVSGNMLTRKHVLDLDPNADGYDEVRQFRMEGSEMVLGGKRRDGSTVEARFHKVPPSDTKPNPVIGVWERVWLIRDGNLQQPPSVPEYIIFGSDGYFMQTELPPGRPKVQKTLAEMTPEELTARFDHFAVAFGNYSVAENIVTRKHLRTDDPNTEGYEQVRGFRFESGFLRMRGPNANGTLADAWFRRVK
jgi:Lipocalin-like domain